jgi:hypothetical protein
LLQVEQALLDALPVVTRPPQRVSLQAARFRLQEYIAREGKQRQPCNIVLSGEVRAYPEPSLLVYGEFTEYLPLSIDPAIS